MKKNRILFLVVHSLVILILLAGCLRTEENDLKDTSWVVTKINDEDPIDGTILTLEFTEDVVAGRAGCNHYEGSYTIDGENIQFESVFNTEMACLDPEGVMDQEQVFLAIFRSAVRYELVDDELIIFNNENNSINFVANDESIDSPNQGENDNDQVVVSNENPTDEVEINQEPSWEHNLYQDPETGIRIFIPKTWIVTGIIEGEYAILQSYAEDKYIGGEPREEGDTKCDLNIQPDGTSVEELIEQWKSSSMTTILSEEPFTLNSGESGTRFEIENMGQSISVVTELSGRVVVLTCFGDYSMVDEIAATLDYKE